MEHVEKDKLLRFFQSKAFKLVTLVSLLIPMIIHTATLLLELSVVKSKWYAYFFAFAFDLGIFAFSINGKIKLSVGLAFIVFFLNVCFFNLPYFYEIYGQNHVKLAITIIISGSSAFILKNYVNFFNKGEQVAMENLEEEKLVLTGKLEALENRVSRINAENIELRSALTTEKALHEQLKKNNEDQTRYMLEVRKKEELIKSTQISYPYKCLKGCNQTFNSQESHEKVKLFCNHCTNHELEEANSIQVQTA